MTPGPVAIIVASGDLSRYPAFNVCLWKTWRPHGSDLFWQEGLNPSANFNECIRRIPKELPDAEWVWILGDDHAWYPDTLVKLLEHAIAANVDVLVPRVVRRRPPLMPVLFKATYHTPGMKAAYDVWEWSELPRTGLHEVYTAGSAGMLVRRTVLDKIGDPWFESGQLGTEVHNEDTHFCLKVQRAGFRIFADMDVSMDHITPCTLRSVLTEKGWVVQVDIGGVTFNLPYSERSWGQSVGV